MATTHILMRPTLNEQALPDKIGSKMDQLMNINCLYVSSLRYVKVDFDPQGLRPQRIQVEQVEAIVFNIWWKTLYYVEM